VLCIGSTGQSCRNGGRHNEFAQHFRAPLLVTKCLPTRAHKGLFPWRESLFWGGFDRFSSTHPARGGIAERRRGRQRERAGLPSAPRDASGYFRTVSMCHGTQVTFDIRPRQLTPELIVTDCVNESVWTQSDGEANWRSMT